MRGGMTRVVNRDNKGWLLPALFIWLAGCAGIPEHIRDLPDPRVAVELVDTPFFAQERYQCGPAALATVLTASGVPVKLDDLVKKVYIPAREGAIQVELLAATRTSGRLPYLLNESLAAIVSELQAGRPVVVLQNLGVSMIPRWHYSVVVGVDAAQDVVILRSGTDKRRQTPLNVFLRTWARSDYWAMSVLRPGVLPADVDRERYFSSVVGLEQAGMHAEAISAWRAALAEWPDSPVALFGLGNAFLSINEFAEAEKVYRELLAAQPALNVARNNLAMALAGQARYAEAIAEINEAVALERDAVLIEELRDTLAEIQQMAVDAEDIAR